MPLISDHATKKQMAVRLSNKIEDVGKDDDRHQSQHPLDQVECKHHPSKPLLTGLDTIWVVLAHLGKSWQHQDLNSFPRVLSNEKMLRSR